MEHGTRTMYQKGCRCDACCRAEHEQYLKRKEAQCRVRTNSKWSPTEYTPVTERHLAQRKHNKKRHMALKNGMFAHTAPIRWTEIAQMYKNKCAICGCHIDPNDKWIGKGGRMCYGPKYPTVDHIIPLKCGGSDIIDNVQLLCKHCNSKKGASVDATVYSEPKGK